MCQEYQCDCCSDELPEDSCECVECDHVDQHATVSQWTPWDKQCCCDALEDFCDREKPINSSSHALSTHPSRREAYDCCRDSPCEIKCCPGSKDVGRSPIVPNTANVSRKQPKKDFCCELTNPDLKEVDSFPFQGSRFENEACQSEKSDLCSQTTPHCSEEEKPEECCVSCHATWNSVTDASSVSSCCEALSSHHCSYCQVKPCDVKKSHNLATDVTCSPPKDSCCSSEPCHKIMCGSRVSLESAMPSSPDDKCCDSKLRNSQLCESRNQHVTVTCSPTEDKCCESMSCNDDSKTCDSGEDDCCNEKLQVEDSPLTPLSRISMTDCSGFYPNLPTSPQAPNVKSNNSSGKKPLVRENTTKLRVQNICCAMETKLVQESLEPLEGVISIAVNGIGRVVFVRYDPELTSPSELVSALNRVHLGASIMESGSHPSHGKVKSLPRSLSSFFIYLLIQTILLIVAVIAFFVKASWYQWVAIAEIVFGIAPVLKKASVSFKTLTIDINMLMLIAIAGTLAIREWVEGAAVVYVFSLAEALQEFCMHRVQRTISGLMLKAPQVAILASTCECVPVEEVTIGTVIAIRPGELIPLDGKVVSGQAAVDESSVSGESVPVEKTVGSEVFSGTVNQNGYLEVETTSDSTSSTVTKVAQLVQEAQTGSAKTELAINRFAKYYTPAVVIAAVLVVAIPAILGAAGVGTYSEEIREWGRRALILLVVACPCALVMSTPIAVVCGITAAARKGALIKGGTHLETLARLEVLALDKTGTLTEGKFQVVDINCSFGVQEGSALRLAAALETKSSHPLAAAIVNEFAGCVTEMVTSQISSLPEVSRFELHEGQGISGIVEDHLVQIGNYEFLHGIAGKTLNREMEDKYIAWSNESKTVIFVCVDNKLAMMMALADTVRANSLVMLDWLRNLHVQSAMITGDNSGTAMAVKGKLGLDECVAEMKPQDKLRWITHRQAGLKDDDEGKFEGDQPRRCFSLSCCSCRRYQIVRSRDSKKSIVGMVGDGVNDGPALAMANVGIAMGAGGTALAVEAADVALMSNNLAKIPELVELGRFCLRIVAQNIAFSVVLKLAIVIAALAGKASLWMAVMADVLGLLFVILNGLRPLWWKVAEKGNSKITDIELAFVKNARQGCSYECYV